MRLPGLCVLAVAAALSAGCGSFATRGETAPGADLSAVRTFAWMEGQELGFAGSASDREHLSAAAAEALSAGFQARGLAPAGAGAPDVFVAFRAEVERETYVTDFGHSTAGSWNRAGFYGRRGYDPMVVTYDAGTLIVDVVDARTQKLLWRGTARADVDRNDTRADREAQVRAAAASIAAEWPGAGAK